MKQSDSIGSSLLTYKSVVSANAEDCEQITSIYNMLSLEA